MNHQIDTLLSESRRFPPPPGFAAQAIATMRDISHQMLKDHQAQMRLLQR